MERPMFPLALDSRDPTSEPIMEGTPPGPPHESNPRSSSASGTDCRFSRPKEVENDSVDQLRLLR